MKKRYLPKPDQKKEMIRGAYDINGDWWYENDIMTFTGGMITMFFKKDRNKIKIIEIEKNNINQKNK